MLEQRNEGSKNESLAAKSSLQATNLSYFEQPVVLKQSPIWSRAVIWTLMGVTTVVITWACVAQMEEAIPAQGKLEPEGTVAEVQAPVGGVVKEILVQDGQQVNQGDLLITLDPEVAQAQQASLQKIRLTLKRENDFYQALLSGLPISRVTELSGLTSLPTGALSLTQNRAALVAENQLYRMQLSGDSQGVGLTLEQQARLRASQAELNSRTNADQLEVKQLERQLEEAKIQLASAQDLLKVEQQVLKDLTPLVEQGGLSKIQYVRQQQQTLTRQADVDRYAQELRRIEFAIAQAQQKAQTTVSFSQADILTKITNNEKQIADIDSQLTKAVVENSKRIAEIDSQLSQAKTTLRYQDLRSPVTGTVFDLQAKTPGFVTTNTEPILKIVPADALVAKVFITNRDIGFIREQMDADVRIDSFPFSEFGDVKGKLIWIGSDALPPDQIRPFYSFPAKIRLERQNLKVNNREIQLQSGMSISVNIKVRKRTVASLFTDLFAKKVESLKTVR
ncbi:MAG: HlyD family efflux transporter periplasmic adaptor subunit [Leptolyngbyaceae bacterium]|nr:HlyD family efflux transporter periplasmic adaptor subunit [Leptolyngbyaceae bacterium]